MKKPFYVSLILLTVIFYCKNSTDPDVNSRNYIVTEIHGMTVEEFFNKYYETPLIKEIKLIDYEFCSTIFNGQVLIKDKGWFDIRTPYNPGHKWFIVYINNQIEGIEAIWFYIYNISDKKIDGDYECIPYDQGIDPAPIQFSAIQKGKFRIKDY
ncbi:hypothetical protein ACFL4T_03580 [candidate division KSB1 bacterium]